MTDMQSTDRVHDIGAVVHNDLALVAQANGDVRAVNLRQCESMVSRVSDV